MVIRAQIGDSPNVRILVLGLGLIHGVVLLGDVVDAALILFAVGVNHWCSVSTAGVAFALHVSFLFTISTHNVGISGPVAADRGGVHGCGGVAVVVLLGTRGVALADGSDLFDLLQGQVVPGDVDGLGQRHAGLDRGDFLAAPVVIMDGFQLASVLHALLEALLPGLDNLVVEGLLNSSQE